MTIEYKILSPIQFYTLTRSLGEFWIAYFIEKGGCWLVEYEDRIATDARHFHRRTHAEFWMKEIIKSKFQLKLNEIDY